MGRHRNGLAGLSGVGDKRRYAVAFPQIGGNRSGRPGQRLERKANGEFKRELLGVLCGSGFVRRGRAITSPATRAGPICWARNGTDEDGPRLTSPRVTDQRRPPIRYRQHNVLPRRRHTDRNTRNPQVAVARKRIRLLRRRKDRDRTRRRLTPCFRQQRQELRHGLEHIASLVPVNNAHAQLPLVTMEAAAGAATDYEEWVDQRLRGFADRVSNSGRLADAAGASATAASVVSSRKVKLSCR